MATPMFGHSKRPDTNWLRSEIFHRKCAICASMSSATQVIKPGVNNKQEYTKFTDNHCYWELV